MNEKGGNSVVMLEVMGVLMEFIELWLISDCDGGFRMKAFAQSLPLLGTLHGEL